jgi:Zn-dependent M28 family amino/carboxypeptidase
LTTAVEGAGALGVVVGSRNDLTITSGSYRIEWDKLPTQRRITIRKADMDKVMLALDTKRSCELEFEMEQSFIKGPRKLCNVVAEIKGTEKPDEVVIVSGHLDSWDGPGSQGALDNGTGTCVALEAARILCKAGAKPKRTIRFILWTGEEQGLFGSQWYVQAHKDELPKISAVFVDDGGTNYEGGLTCTKEMEPLLRKAQEPMTGVFKDMPFEIRVAERIPRGGGSDHAPFNANGVPGFFWFETGRSDYNFVHHTQHDRYEMAIPEYLVQSSTNSAIMSYNLACADTLLPREQPTTPPPTGGGGG